MPVRLVTYNRSEDIPQLPGVDAFHSTEAFKIFEKTSGHKAMFIVAYEDEKPIGKMLAVTRPLMRFSSFWTRTTVYGVGEYFNTEMKHELIFREIVSYLTSIFSDSTTVLEFRNLREALFGYKYFRENGFFPVRWIRVVNSIHHTKLDKWMSSIVKQHIESALAKGAVMEVAKTHEEVEDFFRMMKNFYSSKFNRFFPDISFFKSILSNDSDKLLGKIFLVKYNDRIIGGSVCVFSGENVYLLFSAGLRKSFPTLYPGTLAIWKAMLYSRKQGYRHLEFINAGLPFHKFGYRDFILKFGGMQLGSRRWFRLKYPLLNRILIKLYV